MDDPELAWATISPSLRALCEEVCTARQVQVLQLIAAGYGLSQAARALGVSIGTVEIHLERAAQKISRARGAGGANQDPR